MAAREESHGIIKPIIIGVVTTVLSTGILYLLNLEKAPQRHQEPLRVEVHEPNTLPERLRYPSDPESTTPHKRRGRYRPSAQDILDERSRRYDEPRTVIDRHNRTAKAARQSPGWH